MIDPVLVELPDASRRPRRNSGNKTTVAKLASMKDRQQSMPTLDLSSLSSSRSLVAPVAPTITGPTEPTATPSHSISTVATAIIAARRTMIHRDSMPDLLKVPKESKFELQVKEVAKLHRRASSLRKERRVGQFAEEYDEIRWLINTERSHVYRGTGLRRMNSHRNSIMESSKLNLFDDVGPKSPSHLNHALSPSHNHNHNPQATTPVRLSIPVTERIERRERDLERDLLPPIIEKKGRFSGKLGEKMQNLKNDPLAYAALTQRVQSIQRERKQSERGKKTHRPAIHRPDEKLEAITFRSMERSRRDAENRERREVLEQELIERHEAMTAREASKQMAWEEKKAKLARRRFCHIWLITTAVASRSTRLMCELQEAKRRRQIFAAHEKSAFIIQYNYRMFRFRLQRKRVLQGLSLWTIAALTFGRMWTRMRRRRDANRIKHTLRLLLDTNSFLKAIRRFQSVVLVLQRCIRRHLFKRNAEVALLVMQFDRVEETMLAEGGGADKSRSLQLEKKKSKKLTHENSRKLIHENSKKLLKAKTQTNVHSHHPHHPRSGSTIPVDFKVQKLRENLGERREIFRHALAKWQSNSARRTSFSRKLSQKEMMDRVQANLSGVEIEEDTGPPPPTFRLLMHPSEMRQFVTKVQRQYALHYAEKLANEYQ
jgi:hypothetical protein